MVWTQFPYAAVHFSAQICPAAFMAAGSVPGSAWMDSVSPKIADFTTMKSLPCLPWISPLKPPTRFYTLRRCTKTPWRSERLQNDQNVFRTSRWHRSKTLDDQSAGCCQHLPQHIFQDEACHSWSSGHCRACPEVVWRSGDGENRENRGKKMIQRIQRTFRVTMRHL